MPISRIIRRAASGLESGAVVVIDCFDGRDTLALSSMPCIRSQQHFTDGIGRLEWKMLNEDERIPMLNKALRGLYPPGSTLQTHGGCLALQAHGYRSRRSASPAPAATGSATASSAASGGHGPVEHGAPLIEKSCNTYFYAMGRRIGYDAIAPVAKAMGLGRNSTCPAPVQRYGTIPDSAWKMRKLVSTRNGLQSDTLNATIGQGYVSVSPLQLAVMAARIATGRASAIRIFVPCNDGPARCPRSCPGLARAFCAVARRA